VAAAVPHCRTGRGADHLTVLQRGPASKQRGSYHWIQANIVEVGGQKALDFVTIIDAYEEPEEEETVTETFDRQHWVDNYPWVLEMAEYFRDCWSHSMESQQSS